MGGARARFQLTHGSPLRKVCARSSETSYSSERQKALKALPSTP